MHIPTSLGNKNYIHKSGKENVMSIIFNTDVHYKHKDIFEKREHGRSTSILYHNDFSHTFLYIKLAKHTLLKSIT